MIDIKPHSSFNISFVFIYFKFFRMVRDTVVKQDRLGNVYYKLICLEKIYKVNIYFGKYLPT